MTDAERVRVLSNRVLGALDDDQPQFALMALIDAAVRIIQVAVPGMPTAAALDHLANTIKVTAEAERGGHGPDGG